MILTGVLLSITHQTQILVMGNIRSLEDAGIIRALDNFIQPMVVIITAIGTLFLPVFSAQYRKPGAANYKKNGALITFVVFLLSLMYGLFLWLRIYGLFLLVFRFQLENLFFGGIYVDYIFLIPLFSLVPILMSLTIGASVILKAIQKPQALFIVSVGSVVTSAVTSFVFIPIWGIAGAVWSAVITQAVSTILIFVLFTRRFIKEDYNRISD
jgi:O-antigen/teichoic acid export membrane protein